MLLQIDGWWGGGKSLLASLLDGHPEIAVTPIHEATHMAFLSANEADIFRLKDLNYIRRIIASKSEYYNLEKFSRLGFRRMAFNKDVALRLEMVLDFYDFDKSWVDNLLQTDIWNEENILRVIYQTLHQKLLHTNSTTTYEASMSWPRLMNQLTFFEKLPNAKNILIKRPVIDVIASRAGRKPMENTLNNHFAPGFEKIIHSNEVSDIMTYYDYWEKQQKKNPQQVFITDISSLIYNRQDEMRKIAQFLGIDYLDILQKATFLGKEILHNGMSYADQVFDTAENVLTSEEIRLVEQQIRMFSPIQ